MWSLYINERRFPRSTLALIPDQLLEPRLVEDSYRGTARRQDPLALKVTKESSHGFSGCADHFRDFFARECETRSNLAFARSLVAP